MPKVSVIIPTHNRASFLPAAVQSVLNQTFQDFEVIVVDDASDDETPAVMRSFTDPRITYVRHDSNKGQGETRNDGIRRATGEYIALLDDDDEWLPQKLEKQVHLLDGSSTMVGLVYTGFRKIDARTREVVGEVVPDRRGYVFEEIARRNWIGTCSTVLCRRSCLKIAGLFDETLVAGVDYDLWLRISRQYQVEYIKDPLVNYNVHNSNLSNNYAMVIRGMETTNRKYGHLFNLHRKSYSDRYHSIGMFYCLNGNLRQGREAFWNAIRLYPFDGKYYFRLATTLLGAKTFRRANDFKEKLTAWVKHSPCRHITSRTPGA
jgi:glycosyltransferase involved in cell wall biosynthesis